MAKRMNGEISTQTVEVTASQEELLDAAEKLEKSLSDQDALDAEKTRWMADWKSRKEDAQAVTARFRRAVKTGKVEKTGEVQTTYIKSTGKIEVTWTKTGEVVETRTATLFEASEYE